MVSPSTFRRGRSAGGTSGRPAAAASGNRGSVRRCVGGASAHLRRGLRDTAQGGNAFDAGVAALLVGGVVERISDLGGEALVLV
jgi:gamma-glutamyltranspeptidase